MPEAVELLYIRHGLNDVIEQFSIYVFKCCTRATTPQLLENRKKWPKIDNFLPLSVALIH